MSWLKRPNIFRKKDSGEVRKRQLLDLLVQYKLFKIVYYLKRFKH